MPRGGPSETRREREATGYEPLDIDRGFCFQTAPSCCSKTRARVFFFSFAPSYGARRFATPGPFSTSKLTDLYRIPPKSTEELASKRVILRICWAADLHAEFGDAFLLVVDGLLAVPDVALQHQHLHPGFGVRVRGWRFQGGHDPLTTKGVTTLLRWVSREGSSLTVSACSGNSDSGLRNFRV